MKRVVGYAGGCLLLLVLASSAGGELIPTPSFSDHVVPTTEVPSTEGAAREWGHVALLVVALVLASYFALVARSRKHLLILSVACLIWFGFVRQGCDCSIGATQNVTQGLCDSAYVVPWTTLAFFALPLLFTLFFGRTFCAAVCPLGAVQEVVAVRSVRVPLWLDHALGLFPYLYLGAAVLFAIDGIYIICRYDPIVPLFRLGGNYNILILTGCVLAISLFVGRPYCRYICPYGAVLRVLSRVSKWHLRIVPGECISCRLCEDACPYGAIQEPTVALTPDQRVSGRRQLSWLLVSVPLLVAVPAWLGTDWSQPLSRLDPVVRLAEQVYLEENQLTEETTDASDAFRNTGQSPTQLFAQADELRQRYARKGGWLGAWFGIVLSVKLVHLSVRRRREGYHPDRAGCVSCGRCFTSCPVELVRLGRIQDVSEVVGERKT